MHHQTLIWQGEVEGYYFYLWREDKTGALTIEPNASMARKYYRQILVAAAVAKMGLDGR